LLASVKMNVLRCIFSPLHILSHISAQVIAVQGSSTSVLGQSQIQQTKVAVGQPHKLHSLLCSMVSSMKRELESTDDIL